MRRVSKYKDNIIGGFTPGCDKVAIYGLREKGSLEIRYVGQTREPKSRFSIHVTEIDKYIPDNPKRQWFESIHDLPCNLEMVILDECDFLSAVDRENYWIGHFTKMGHRLTNSGKACDTISTSRARAKEEYRLRQEELKRTNPEEYERSQERLRQMRSEMWYDWDW